jgi:hypothetical protein
MILYLPKAKYLRYVRAGSSSSSLEIIRKECILPMLYIAPGIENTIKVIVLIYKRD